jgi:hypothetical protein
VDLQSVQWAAPRVLNESGPSRRRKWARLVEWARDNPDKVLPRSIQGIVDMTGCSKDQVKSYLSRRRREAKALTAKLPDLRALPMRIVDAEGCEFLTSDFVDYRYAVDHWAAKVSVEAQVLGSSGQLEKRWFDIWSLDYFVEAVAKLQKLITQGVQGLTLDSEMRDTSHPFQQTQSPS